MKELAVIILNWNGQRLLGQFLPSVERWTAGEEVDLIVADNGSTDSSVSYMKENHPDIKVIALDRNYGFAEGYNRAIRILNDSRVADGLPPYPFTLLLNSDVEVKEGWWQPLLRFMKMNPDVGAAQPKIKSWHDKESFEYAGAAGGYLDRLGYPYCRGRLFDAIEKDLGQYDDAPADICWASGAALIVRTDLYLQLGGLDKDFFAHMEEIDLCCRIHAAGFRVCAIPDSEIFHVGGASLNQGNPQKTYLNFRNNLLLLHKNLPAKVGQRKLFFRRLADTLAFFMFLAKFDFPNAKAILKAHRDFRKMRGNYTNLPLNDKLSSLPGAKRNIIIDRFLLRKRK